MYRLNTFLVLEFFYVVFWTRVWLWGLGKHDSNSLLSLSKNENSMFFQSLDETTIPLYNKIKHDKNIKNLTKNGLWIYNKIQQIYCGWQNIVKICNYFEKNNLFGWQIYNKIWWKYYKVQYFCHISIRVHKKKTTFIFQKVKKRFPYCIFDLEPCFKFSDRLNEIQALRFAFKVDPF
jgi:hypothetical protein